MVPSIIAECCNANHNYAVFDECFSIATFSIMTLSITIHGVNALHSK
jgi:hypothetical protein